MNSEDIVFVKYRSLACRQFRHWIWLNDLRSGRFSKTKKKQTFIRYIEVFLGPLSKRWQYEFNNDGSFILKVSTDIDLIFLLLKFRKQ